MYKSRDWLAKTWHDNITHTHTQWREKTMVLTRTPVDMSIAKTTMTTSSGWANKFTLDQ